MARIRWELVVPCFALLGAVLYRSAPSLGFLGDDLWVLGGAISPPLFSEYTSEGASFLRPLPSVTHWLEYRFFGTEPAGYHVVNVMVHVAVSLLVIVLVRALLRSVAAATGSERSSEHALLAPIVAGLVFLVLPSHGEAVYWVSARADLVMTFTGVLAVVAFLQSTHSPRPSWWRIGAGAALGLSLLSKESAVAVPLVLVWLSVALSRLEASRDVRTGSSHPETRAWAWIGVRRALPMVGLLVPYFLLRHWALGTVVGVYGSDTYADVSVARALAQGTFLFVRSVLPPGPPVYWMAVFIGAVAMAVGVIWVRARRAPTTGRTGAHPDSAQCAQAAALSFGAWVLCLLPVVPLGVSLVGPGGERLVYLPSAFAAATLGLVAVIVMRAGTAREQRLVLVAIAAVVVVMSGAVVVESRRWMDASAVATSVTRDLLAEPDGAPVWLVGSPDNVRGVISMRNVPAGLDLLASDRGTPEVAIVSAASLDRPFERVEVAVDGAAVTIRRERPAAPGVEISDVDDGPWSVRRVDPWTEVIRFDDPADLAKVRYVSEGRVRALPSGR